MSILEYVVISPAAITRDIIDNINMLFYAVVALSVLILIMLITYFVKIKPNLKGSVSEQTASSNPSIDNVISQIESNEQEELVNDYELVAVITAAIYASMGGDVPADGFVVRSIRKVNSKKWMNA